MIKTISNTETPFSHNPSYALAPSDFELVDKILIAAEQHFKKDVREPEPAAGFLKEAQEAMELKAKLRDTPKGERTAEQIANVFNAITGHELTETDAWTFLLVLKLVRSRNGKYNRDDYVDLAAYSSLMGECASAGQ